MVLGADVVLVFPMRNNKNNIKVLPYLYAAGHDGNGTAGYRVTDIGPALYHPGTASSRFQTDSLTFLDGGTTWPPFTMACLLKRDGAAATGRFIRAGNPASIDWQVAETTGGVLRFFSTNSSGASDGLNGTTVYPGNEWFTTAVTWDGKTKRLWYNGRLEASSTPTNIQCRTDGTNQLIWAEGTNGFKGYYGLMVLSRTAWGAGELNAFHRDPWGIVRPVYPPKRVAVVSGQIIRPVATLAAGAWTAVGAATLHEAIDEVPINDSDYISYTPTGPTPDTAKFGLTDLNTGVGPQNVTIVARTEATEL